MNFYQEVYKLVKKIPKGKVATYGQIATLISTPRAARAVGYALRTLPENTDIPWWRVINSKGEISIQNIEHPAEEQSELLKQEGVVISKSNEIFSIDLSSYIWKKK